MSEIGAPMSETRYSPEQLDAAALESYPNRQKYMAICRQAALDARAIDQLREWLEKRRAAAETHMSDGNPSAYAVRGLCVVILAELDRLTHPAEEAEQ